MTPRPICVIGNANPDIVLGQLTTWPEPGTEIFLERCDTRPGGSAANTALVLQQLGAQAGLVSATGADTLGEWLASHFTGPLDRVAKLNRATGLSVGVLLPGAERSFLSFDGHLDALDLDIVLKATDGWPLSGALVLVAGQFALPALAPDIGALMTRLTLADAEIAIDPGWPGPGWTADTRTAFRASARHARHLLVNDKEVTGLMQMEDPVEAATALLEELPKGARVVVKCGAEGAFAVSAEGTARAAAPAVSPFDTVGAGDAFNAGYLDAVARALPLDQALAMGTTTASTVIADFPRNASALRKLADA